MDPAPGSARLRVDVALRTTPWSSPHTSLKLGGNLREGPDIPEGYVSTNTEESHADRMTDSPAGANHAERALGDRAPPAQTVFRRWRDLSEGAHSERPYYSAPGRLLQRGLFDTGRRRDGEKCGEASDRCVGLLGSRFIGLRFGGERGAG